MATSAVAVGVPLNGSRCLAWDIIASADADTTLAIPHGIIFALSTNPARVTRTVLQPTGALFYLQAWIVASITNTTLTLTKTLVAAGSGDAGSHCRVFLEYLTS
jgi:hypothetical protein